MPITKSRKRESSRASRKRFARMHSRSIGLECLERRSLMASDLAPFLEEARACLASEADQPIAVTSQAISSAERSVEEIANSPISLLEGDVIALQVPDYVLSNYIAQGTYEVRVAYSQNYFTYETNIGGFGSDSLDRSGARDMLDTPQLDSASLNDGRAAATTDDNDALHQSVQSNANSADNYAMLVLASLTARQDFDGNVRMLDNADQTSVNPSDDSYRLPSEIRIEPKLTAPTALRDPGPTVIKTIVVNRIADGLAVSESTASQPPTAQQTKVQPDTPAPNLPTQDTTPSRQNRSTVNLKTIDISQSRRSDTNRSWIRSTTIANPSHPKDFGFQSKPAVAVAQAQVTAPASAADIDSIAKPQRKAGIQNAGTKLVPVEFLLSKNVNDLDRNYSMDEQNEEQSMAADQAIREYMDESENPLELNPLEQLRDLGLLAASRVQSEDTAKTWTAARIDDTNNDWSNAAILYMQGVQLGVASNQESWKRMLRTASESTAGQMVLASLSALAAQKGEANAFGSKSAWEFVNKSPKNS